MHYLVPLKKKTLKNEPINESHTEPAVSCL